MGYYCIPELSFDYDNYLLYLSQPSKALIRYQSEPMLPFLLIIGNKLTSSEVLLKLLFTLPFAMIFLQLAANIGYKRYGFLAIYLYVLSLLFLTFQSIVLRQSLAALFFILGKNRLGFWRVLFFLFAILSHRVIGPFAVLLFIMTSLRRENLFICLLLVFFGLASTLDYEIYTYRETGFMRLVILESFFLIELMFSFVTSKVRLNSVLWMALILASYNISPDLVRLFYIVVIIKILDGKYFVHHRKSYGPIIER